jgi:hypothetical protein
MTNRNSILKYLFLSVIVVVTLISSCTKQSIVTGNGVLKGKISIGPICPVETIPPQPGCLPTRDWYNNYATAVWTSDKKNIVGTIIPNLDGIYLIDLPAGDYVLDYVTARTFGVGGSKDLPKAFSIADKDTLTLNVSIDTGIR